MQDFLDEWFKREVVVHEEALTRYLRRCWPHPDDIHDLRQDVYIRVYESARRQLPACTRTFIFAIAKHLLVDRVRKRRVVVIDSVGDLGALNVLVDDVSPERRTAAHQELRQLALALNSLPRRCREVVWLRRVDDLSQKDVAARLGLKEKTVEKHLTKGMKRLTDAAFVAASVEALTTSSINQGREHGEQ